MFVVITENDESQWDDITGDIYHFPGKYLKYLQPGTQAIYYKGILKNNAFRDKRLSPQPHYFGIAIIGANFKDQNSNKNDYFCKVQNFTRFSKPILAKINGKFLEEIPPSRITNYWRDGVRQIDEKTFKKIVSLLDVAEDLENQLNDNEQGNDEALTSFEGKKKQKITTTYERDPRLREEAIKIHGLSCMVCDFNFEKVYGEWGLGYIHVHHRKPISEAGFREVKAKDDLVVVCANCHAMIHRKKSRTLEINELKEMMKLIS